MKRRESIIDRQEQSGALSQMVVRLSLPLGENADLDPLLEQIGDARYVLLGEASHGTSEYYQWRTRISQRLVCEKGFSFIAVEGDWPDCYRVNRYVKSRPNSGCDARDVLKSFVRWPTWMWANEEIVNLTEWLRAHNGGLPDEQQVGFYGLDVYSLWDSLHAVFGYLQKENPSLVPAARRALRCFQPYGEDVQHYARSTVLVPTSCEDEVVSLLRSLRNSDGHIRSDGRDGFFVAEQNALVVKNAEAYYRAMVRGGPESWNIRDRHMVETLDRLMRQHGPAAKAIVWEHNTHVGDARATDMAEQGMVNVGQLVRQQHASDEVFVVGFGSYLGTVVAALDWEAPTEIMVVPPARDGSWEAVFHNADFGADGKNRLLLLNNVRYDKVFMTPRSHRAIGVVYHADYERFGNYVPTVLPRRYDAFCYLDQTQALHPLSLHPDIHMLPETYPWGV